MSNKSIEFNFHKVLQAESEALAAVSIDEVHVRRAVDLIVSATTLTIVTGVGKSGLVARKIAASMSSLGLPAAFLDPTSAAHGDLGLVVDGSTMIALSNSGNTAELVAILPALAARGARLISIVGNPGSRLAKSADAALIYGKIDEADALGLAPTSSTTVQMAIGDALAICASQVQGVTKEKFLYNHPAGTLGRGLMKVEQMMRTGDDVPRIGVDAGFAEVVETISSKRMGLVCVVDEGENLVGIISDGDIRALLGGDRDPRSAKVADIMRTRPETVSTGLRIAEVIERDRGLARHLSLPVVTDGKLVGVLVALDLLN